MTLNVREHFARNARDIGKDLTTTWESIAALPKVTLREELFHATTVAYLDIRRSWGTSCKALLLLAMSCALAVFFIILALSLGGASRMDQERIRIFLTDQITEPVKAEIEKILLATIHIHQVIYRDKDDALREYVNLAGRNEAELITLLGENPLPASFEVLPSSNEVAPQVVEHLERSLISHDGVASVRSRGAFVLAAAAAAKQLRKLSFFAALAVTLIAALIVGLIVELLLHAYREEYEIIDLLGAPARFRLLPSLVEGVFLGGVGALLGGLLGLVAWNALAGELSLLVIRSGFTLAPPMHPSLLIAGAIMVGICIGGISSLWSARRVVS